jgi:pimeloyl-ACP methyl ester carboxylesterase
MNNIVKSLKQTPYYKIIPPFLLSYLFYKRYKLINNPCNAPMPIKSDKYLKEKIKYDYDSIQLTNGFCHYRTNIITPPYKNEDMDIFVFIHRNEGSIYDFQSIINEINILNKHNTLNKQHRPLYYVAYDLYGRGYSHYDNSPQNLQLFISQLSELLFMLNINCKVHLVGWEMGAACASGFASIYPHKIKSLTLLSPIGYKSYRELARPWWYKYITSSNGLLTLLSIYNNVIYNKEAHDYEEEWNDTIAPTHLNYLKHRQQYFDNIDYNININCNIVSNWKSYINDFPIGELDHIYKQINIKIKHVYIMWGEADSNNPIDNLPKIANILNNCQTRIFPDYKHSYPLEHGKMVFSNILEWMFKIKEIDKEYIEELKRQKENI